MACQHCAAVTSPFRTCDSGQSAIDLSLCWKTLPLKC